MNKKVFTNTQEWRAANAMAELFDSLRSIHLQNGSMEIPKATLHPEYVHAELHKILVIGSREVALYELGDVHTGGNTTPGALSTVLTPQIICSDGIKSKSGSAFYVEGIPYLARLHSSGIVITNLGADIHESRQIFFERQQRHIHSNSILSVGTHLDDIVLFTPHSEGGLYRFPLKDLVQNTSSVFEHPKYSISLQTMAAQENGNSDQDCPVGFHRTAEDKAVHPEIYNIYPIRIAPFGASVVLGVERNIFEYNAVKNELEFRFRLPTESKGTYVTSLDTAGDVIYCGLNDGSLFRNTTKIYSNSSHGEIAKMAIKNSGEIAFNTFTNGLFGPLRILNTQLHEEIIGSPLCSIRDMVLRNNTLCALDTDKVMVYSLRGPEITLAAEIHCDIRKPYKLIGL